MSIFDRYDYVDVAVHFTIAVVSAIIAYFVSADTSLSMNFIGVSMTLTGSMGAFAGMMMKWFVICGLFEFIICALKGIAKLVSLFWEVCKGGF